MIKTEYLGWKLSAVVHGAFGQGWYARYYSFQHQPPLIQGEGHSPESALADAQKEIKKVMKK